MTAPRQSIAPSALRRRVLQALVPVHVAVILALPALCAAAPLLAADEGWARALTAAAAPPIYLLAYALTCGLLSRPWQRAIVPGRFPRDLGHAVYGPRRMYGLCWTMVYYFPLLYQVVLAVPALRRVVLRLFGYRGALDATLYPDAWVRDLPLLELGEGAYVSNKATVGTNICLIDGTILVDRVRVERGAVVGHLAMLAPGVVVGEGAEIGVGSAIGIGVVVGARSSVAPTVTINHGARLGTDVRVGTMSYIGTGAVIADGICVPPATRIPDRAVIRCQADVEEHARSGAAPEAPASARALQLAE